MTRPARGLMAASACLAAALAFVASFAISDDEPAPARAASMPASSSALPGSRDLGAVAGFAAISERPLFAPTRRPIPPAPPPPPLAVAVTLPPPSLPTPGPLLAVLIGPERRAAILRLPDGHASTVSEGGGVGGWTVDQVLPDRVRLRAGADMAELTFPMRNEVATQLKSIAAVPSATARRRR